MPAAPSRQGVPDILEEDRRETLPYLDLHPILDNYAPHKTLAVQRWLKRHPR